MPKHFAVVNAVAEKIGWGNQPRRACFRGLAQNHAFSSLCGAAAEVSSIRRAA